MGQCVTKSSTLEQVCSSEIKHLENDINMLDKMRDKLVAQQILNEEAIKSVEVIKNLNRKIQIHLGNMPIKSDT